MLAPMQESDIRKETNSTSTPLIVANNKENFVILREAELHSLLQQIEDLKEMLQHKRYILVL
jgi:hypothetical protein